MRVFYEVGFATIVFFSGDVTDDVFDEIIFSYNKTFFCYMISGEVSGCSR
jgi:hypothetical protein